MNVTRIYYGLITPEDEGPEILFTNEALAQKAINDLLDENRSLLGLVYLVKVTVVISKIERRPERRT